MGRFKDHTTILDDKLFRGNLFDQLNAVMQQFRSYLQVRYEFRSEIAGMSGLEAAQRSEVWEYPLDALREAVANALIHRDYTISSSTMIRVFDDHLTITNPGTLPDGICVDQLYYDPHPSRRRNPLLAEAFYYAGIVERWGTGTTRMARLCHHRGLAGPEFQVSPWEFSVTFGKDAFTHEGAQAQGLTQRQIEVMRYARENGSISNAEYRHLAGVSDETARLVMRSLVERGILRVQGRGRSSRYVLTGVDEQG